MLRVFEDGSRNAHAYATSPSAHYPQLCKALLDLQHAADKVFDTVSDRVGAEHQHLKGISSRIRTAKAKIDAISGTKRAITIKSSSTYPSTSSDVEDFHPLFGGKFGGVRTDFPVATLSLNGGLSRESGEDGTLELFRFFSETSHEYLCNDKIRKVGLGNMPSDTNSVADILLFNSTELPYHRYKIADNLVVGEPSIEESLELKHAPLPPPPQSVLQGSKLSSTRSEDFGFRPTLRQVPSFSLPNSLPDLPMVADISWTGSKCEVNRKSLMVPSVEVSVAVDDAIPLKSESGGQSIHGLEQKSNVKETTSLSPPPPRPPHPPPLPPTPLLTSVSCSLISAEEGRHICDSKALTTQVEDTSKSSSLPQIDSQREALMDSIRNPGRTLKRTGLLDCNSKTKDSSVDSTKKSDSLKQSENMGIHPKPMSVNLLADMAASLKMRRLSMQGAAHDKDQSTASDLTSPSASSSKFTLPISNLQAYISRKNEEISEEEDWED